MKHPGRLRPCGLSTEELYFLGQEVAKLLEYRPGADMEKALAQIGGSVRHATRDQIEIRGARDFTVWVDPNCSEFSRRHRLACLLGHYVLHGQAGRLSRQHPPRMWDEANDFAMGFLIAERTLRALLKRAATLGEMVNRFKVPPVLIAMRIKSLSQDSRVEAGETVPKKRR